MSWFDDQIEQCKRMERELLSDSFEEIARTVVGHRVSSRKLKENADVDDAMKRLLQYYRIKEKEQVNARAGSLEDRLDYQLSSSGVFYREVKLTKGWHKDSICPLITSFKEDGHAVTLLPGRWGSYEYIHPKTGKKGKVNAATEKLFSEEALAFYRPFPQRALTTKDLFRYMWDCLTVWDFVSFAVCALIIALVGMLMPKLNQILIGPVVENQSNQLLFAAVACLFFVTLSNLLFSAIRSLLLNRIQTKVSSGVQSAAMMRVLSLPAPFFKNYTSGELSQYLGYLNQLSDIVINSVLSSGITGVFSLVYLTQIFNYAPGLVLPSLLVIVLTVAISLISSFSQLKRNRKIMEISAREKGFLYNAVTGIQKIRLSGAENRAFARWAGHYAAGSDLTYNAPLFIRVSSVITSAITLIGTAVMYYVAVRTRVSVADYYAFNAAYGYLSGAFTTLAGVVMSVANIRPTLSLLQPFLEAEPEISEGQETVSTLAGSIEISRVSFQYEPGETVLDDISITIPSRQYVAIVGRSGCGKSTLMRLLLGFEKPTKGAIYYNKLDTRKLDMGSVRRQIGVVTQDSRIFGGSIFENIAIASPNLTLEQAWEAAELAGLADDIRAMPMGMNTMLQEGSGGISGGQRQRLMIARAIAPKPKVLMFDEATSALDNMTQKQVSDALDSMKCTRIVIAHRLSTIRHCDRILVMDQGHIIEDGTYEQLIEKDGFFADLVKRQRVD